MNAEDAEIAETDSDEATGMPTTKHYEDEHSGIPAKWNPVTSRVIRLAMEVHSRLGPGLPEKLYEEALCYELNAVGIEFRRQAVIRVAYKDIVLSELKIDVLVENGLVVELKAIDKVSDVHLAQLVSYLRAARMPIGLLLNFNVLRLTDGIYRRVNDQIPAAAASFLPSESSVTSAFKADRD